jgi:hypothetical protein
MIFRDKNDRPVRDHDPEEWWRRERRRGARERCLALAGLVALWGVAVWVLG